LLTDVRSLPIDPDLPAKVVIDENTGVIVMGDTVRISKVAVAQGNLTIRITETPSLAAQPVLQHRRHRGRPAHQCSWKTATASSRSSTPASRWRLVAGLNSLGVARAIISILRPSPPARCKPAGGAG
jgi:flagellar P-ring protein precursor FlgI